MKKDSPSNGNDFQYGVVRGWNDCIEYLAEQGHLRGWQPIETANSLCVDQEYYLIYSDDGYEVAKYLEKGTYAGFEWPSVRYSDHIPKNITRWMPLPPTEQSGGE